MAIACDKLLVPIADQLIQPAVKLIFPKLASGSAVGHKVNSRVDREAYLCFLLEPLLVAVDRVLAVRCT